MSPYRHESPPYIWEDDGRWELSEQPTGAEVFGVIVLGCLLLAFTWLLVIAMARFVLSLL
jgi:hypothetical protein